MRDTLEKINRALQCACERNDVIVAALSGLATETTLANIEGLINGLSGTLDDILSLQQFSNWTSIVGNSIEINYYVGVAAGNPSGSTSNIETTVYKTGVNVIFTQTMTYNADNLITSVTTT